MRNYFEPNNSEDTAYENCGMRLNHKPGVGGVHPVPGGGGRFTRFPGRFRPPASLRELQVRRGGTFRGVFLEKGPGLWTSSGASDRAGGWRFEKNSTREGAGLGH